MERISDHKKYFLFQKVMVKINNGKQIQSQKYKILTVGHEQLEITSAANHRHLRDQKILATDERKTNVTIFGVTTNQCVRSLNKL